MLCDIAGRFPCNCLVRIHGYKVIHGLVGDIEHVQPSRGWHVRNELLGHREPHGPETYEPDVIRTEGTHVEVCSWNDAFDRVAPYVMYFCTA